MAEIRKKYEELRDIGTFTKGKWIIVNMDRYWQFDTEKEALQIYKTLSSPRIAPVIFTQYGVGEII